MVHIIKRRWCILVSIVDGVYLHYHVMSSLSIPPPYTPLDPKEVWRITRQVLKTLFRLLNVTDADYGFVRSNIRDFLDWQHYNHKVHTKCKRAVLGPTQLKRPNLLATYRASRLLNVNENAGVGLTSNRCRLAPMASPGGRPQTPCKNIGITINKSYFSRHLIL
jgi:hypothetical protein